jgi:transcriptional regulator with XRE-family HTH domain
MNSKDQEFFRALGARIAQARKAQDLTQQEVAARVGVAQPTYAQYELGIRRPPVSMLPQLAQTLGVALEELMGQNVHPRVKPGPASKLQKQFECIQQFPRAKQRIVIEMLDAFILAQAGH